MKPLLYASAKNSFDATLAREIAFSWSGNQSVKNRVKLYNNETLALVYDGTITTQRLIHTIPAGTLTNGITYRMVVTVYDINDTESDESDPVVFTTYTTPSFGLTIADGDIIHNSSYTIGVTYSQPENEELQEFTINLYMNGTRIWTSGVQYDSSSTFDVVGLEDGVEYTISATGITVHSMDIETDTTTFSVSYNNEGNFVVCYLSNVPEMGMVRAESNIIALDGTCSINPPIFTRNNTCLDVTDGVIYYDSNLSFSGNWKKAFKFYVTEASLNKQLLVMTDRESLAVEIYLRSKYVNGVIQYYFEALVESQLYTNCYHTITFSDLDTEFTLWLTNTDCLFDFYMFV